MTSLSPLMEEILSHGGTVDLTVTGSSMWPMLCNRKSVVRLASVKTPRKGDIPLYLRDNGVYTLHRIVACSGEEYVCCGDNQTFLEKGIRRDQILAVVTAFSRDGKRWHDCRKMSYRAYKCLWMWILPLRPVVSSLAVKAVRFIRRER